LYGLARCHNENANPSGNFLMQIFVHIQLR